MTNAPSSSGEHLLELTDLACNGLLSSEGYIQLDELLSGNRAHQKVYLEYVYLHSNLAEIANADRPTKVMPRIPDDEKKSTSFYRQTLYKNHCNMSGSESGRGSESRRGLDSRRG